MQENLTLLQSDQHLPNLECTEVKFSLCKISIFKIVSVAEHACADPESFVRGGPTLTFFCCFFR